MNYLDISNTLKLEDLLQFVIESLKDEQYPIQEDLYCSNISNFNRPYTVIVINGREEIPEPITYFPKSQEFRKISELHVLDSLINSQNYKLLNSKKFEGEVLDSQKEFNSKILHLHEQYKQSSVFMFPWNYESPSFVNKMIISKNEIAEISKGNLITI